MSEEKAGSSSLNNGVKPKNKKKYLYLDNFNKYVEQQKTELENKLSELWRMYIALGMFTLLLSGAVIYLLIKS